jgi:FAD:protein FMN transferase
MRHVHRFSAMAAQNEMCIDCAPELAAHALPLAEAEVRRIEAKYSRYRQESIVSRINAAAAMAPVTIDEETVALLQYAAACFDASCGLFDITSGVLRRAWRFDSGAPPTQAALDAQLPLVNWDRVEFDADSASVRLPQTGMELDFGGFGKEYAADRAATLLREHGVESGYVNLAGDVAVIGPPIAEAGNAWRIGIAHPRSAGQVISTLELATGGLATSGDYERFMIVDGQRYCHILNAKTGWPVQHLAGVSVVAPSALIAGSLSTIAMLKEGDGVAWLREQAATFFAVTADGGVVSE